MTRVHHDGDRLLVNGADVKEGHYLWIEVRPGEARKARVVSPLAVRLWELTGALDVVPPLDLVGSGLWLHIVAHEAPESDPCT